MKPNAPQNPINANVRIGHVHLKVADLQRSLAFYRDVLGFEVTQRYASQAVFLAAGGYHHHIGLNTWESAGGQPPPPGTTGLYHVAILYPTRAELADALRRLRIAMVPIEGASDHGVSEAIYLRDPDGNGVELYWDRPVAGQLIHDFRPGAGCEPRVMTCQVDLAQLKVERSVLDGFVLRGDQPLCLSLVLRAQALSPAGLSILRVIAAAPFDQPVSVLHILFQRRRAEFRLFTVH
jgi:catechol 2,3-dioxygenase